MDADIEAATQHLLERRLALRRAQADAADASARLAEAHKLTTAAASDVDKAEADLLMIIQKKRHPEELPDYPF